MNKDSFKKLLKTFWEFILNLFPYIILGFSLYTGYIGKNYVMITAFLAFIFLICINNVDKISELKASATGIELKAREVIQKAEITIKELQNLAIEFSKIELSLIIRKGRWPGMGEINSF